MVSSRELLSIGIDKIPNLIIVWTKFARSAHHQIGCDALQEQVRINSVQATLRLPLQRAEPSELEMETEKQWRLQRLALSCFKPLFGQDERHQRRGKVEIEKLSNP